VQQFEAVVGRLRVASKNVSEVCQAKCLSEDFFFNIKMIKAMQKTRFNATFILIPSTKVLYKKRL
jgi:hypothetical protein